MSVEGVIFDCDGTLLDSLPAWMAAQDELARRAHTVFTNEDTVYLGTLTIQETGDFVHERTGFGASGADVAALINDLMREKYQSCARPREGALAFVQGLAQRGIPCSVASSTSPDLLKSALEATGFSSYLTAIVSVDDVGASKRESSVYDQARLAMGSAKQNTWVFEDAAYALKTVIAAGYRTVGIYDNDLSGTLEQLQNADITIQEFTDLSLDEFISMEEC